MKFQSTNWIFRLIPAVILSQTLFFKFSASEESVYIFSTLGLEPFGRIGIGCVELLASGLLLFRRTSPWGALVGFIVMLGAIFSHLFALGIEVLGDGGLLFFYAVISFSCCGLLLYQGRNTFLTFFNRKAK